MVIYIVQDSGQNFSSLLKISENIVTVTSRDYPLFGDANDHVNKIKHVLKHFDVDNDAVVPAGDPINISIVTHEILKKEGKILVLKWDRQTNMYVPVKVNINENNNENNNINENQ